MERQLSSNHLTANVRSNNQDIYTISISSGFMAPIINATALNNCTYCGRLGHTKSVCYRKHGYPNLERKGSKGQNTKKF